MREYKKWFKKAWLWARIRQVRFKRWWFRGDARYGMRWRLGNGAAAGLMLAAVVIPVVQGIIKNNGYELSADTIKLVGNTDPTLAKQLTYDSTTDTYQFNKSAIKNDDQNPAAQLESQVGTASGNGKNKSLYALDVPQDISKGVTYHDINSSLSFSLVPRFSASQGQEVQGHLVFSLGGGAQAIYTLKNNGLKEDIVVQKPTADTMAFSYSLDLPGTLQARVIPNSDGAVGIYSADPALFGDISYGTDADRAAVQKAREHSPKNYLVFGLPSPVVKTVDGRSVGSARFQLQGNQLSVIASGLSDVAGPITIDPSVIVTSTGDFQAGNAEDNIDFGTGGPITRGGLTGGSVSAGWAASGTNFTTGRYGNAAVVYNGYLYVIGGCSVQTSLTACSSGNYLNDVQYIALSSSTGALSGSWTTASATLSSGRFGLSAVAYNNHLYVLGGYSGTTYNNDVQSIALDPSSGAPTGSFASAGNAFINGRYFAGAEAYNNYLYVLGGYNGSTYYADVQYAPINADGTVGAWHYTHNSGDDGTSFSAGFTTGRFGLSVVAYNNYLYVIGGCSAGTCSTYQADVQYAPINSNGTIGTWNTTNSFSPTGAARFGQGVTVYEGYMYLMGGNSGSDQTDTLYAQINANGTLGTWTTANNSNNLAAASDTAAAAWNGYLYTVGGTAGSTPHTKTQIAKIDAVTTTAAYNTTTSYPNNLTAGMVVTYANRIYVIGGNVTGNTNSIVGTVEAATINANGTLGAWTTSGMTPMNPGSGVSLTSAAVYNGYVYVVGGQNNAGNYVQTVQYAPINATTGSVGTWATTTNYPIVGGQGVGNHSATVAYNGYLYYRGNNNGGANNTGGYALICTGLNSGTGGCGSTPGSVGNWNTSTGAFGTLNTARTADTMLAYRGYMYDIAGSTNGGGDLNTVEYAPINSNGSVGSWTTLSSTLNSARERAIAFVSNGYMYVVGGTGSLGTTDLSSVESAPINSDGKLGAWTINATPLPATITQGQGGVYNGYLYSVAGKVGGARVTTTYYARINNGGSGTNGSWITNGTSISSIFSSGWAYGSTFAANGYLYMVGGLNKATGHAVATTYSAPISANGSVGSWSAASLVGSGSGTALNTGRYQFGMAVYNGYVYVYGGKNDTSGITNTVEYAKIGTSGGLSAWTSSTMSLSGGGSVSGQYIVGSAVSNGYLYMVGGNNDTTKNANVYYAPINSNGSVGSWTSTTGFTTARDSMTTFAYGGYLYILGGLDNSGNYLSDIQYAPLKSDGSIASGTWVTSGFTLVQARAGQTAAVSDGYVYLFGGTNNSGSQTDVEYAAIGNGGDVGAWQVDGNNINTTGRIFPGGTVYDGTLYMVGGSAAGTYQTDVQYSSLNQIARVGHYSKLIDLTTITNVTSISYAGIVPNGASSITYRAAGTNAVFGSSAIASSVSGSGSCAGNLSGVRYVWLSVTLDDSTGLAQGGGFGDVVGVTSGSGISNADVTSLTVNYNATHPAPNIRLRGGQTLQSGTLSALDTCGP